MTIAVMNRSMATTTITKRRKIGKTIIAMMNTLTIKIIMLRFRITLEVQRERMNQPIIILSKMKT